MTTICKVNVDAVTLIIERAEVVLSMAKDHKDAKDGPVDVAITLALDILGQAVEVLSNSPWLSDPAPGGFPGVDIDKAHQGEPMDLQTALDIAADHLEVSCSDDDSPAARLAALVGLALAYGETTENLPGPVPVWLNKALDVVKELPGEKHPATGYRPGELHPSSGPEVGELGIITSALQRRGFTFDEAFKRATAAVEPMEDSPW